MSNAKRVLRQRYEMFGAVGVGNFGKVFEGYDRHLQIKCAIKELFPEVTQNPEMMKITQMEVDILKKIDHRYIIKLFDSFSENGTYYLVYEFCERGDLKYNIDKKMISEHDALKIVYQMAEALCELKKHQIIHRDIKPENIFLTNDICKLGDFGLCFKGERIQLSSSVGSLGFLAPETQLQLVYSPKADVYSLGICFYEMIHGDIPFTHNQIEDLAQIKLNLRIDRKPGINVSDETLNLMRRMVEPSEHKRISCNEIRELLAPKFPQYQLGQEYESKGIHQIRRVNPVPVRNSGVGIVVSQPSPIPSRTQGKEGDIDQRHDPSANPYPRSSVTLQRMPEDGYSRLMGPSQQLSKQQDLPNHIQPVQHAYKSYSILPELPSMAPSFNGEQAHMSKSGYIPQNTVTSFQQPTFVSPKKQEVPSRLERPSSQMPSNLKPNELAQPSYQQSLHQPQSDFRAAQLDTSNLTIVSAVERSGSIQPEAPQSRTQFTPSYVTGQPQPQYNMIQPSPQPLNKPPTYLINTTDLNSSVNSMYSPPPKQFVQTQNQMIFSEYGHQAVTTPSHKAGPAIIKNQMGTYGYPTLSSGKRPHFSSMSSLFPPQTQAPQGFNQGAVQAPIGQAISSRPSFMPEGPSPINPAHLPQRGQSPMRGYLGDLGSRPPSPRRFVSPTTGLQITSQPAQHNHAVLGSDFLVPAEERRISVSEQQNQLIRSPSVRRDSRDHASPSPAMQPRSFMPRFVQNSRMVEANSNVEVKSNGNFYLESPPAAPVEQMPKMVPRSFLPAYGQPNTNNFGYMAPGMQMSAVPAQSQLQRQMSNSQLLLQDGTQQVAYPMMNSPQTPFRRPNPLERVVFTEQRNTSIQPDHRGRSVSIDNTFYSRFQGVSRGPRQTLTEQVNVPLPRATQEAISASKGLNFEENKRNLNQPQFHDKVLTRDALQELLQPRMTAPESGSGPSVRPFEISFKNGYKFEEHQPRATVGGTMASGPRPSVNPLLSRVTKD